MGQAASFTGGVLSDYEPWAGGDADSYLSALGSMFEVPFSLAVDQGDPDDPGTYVPGWSTLLDPDLCPAEFLPFLSQFVGAGVQPGPDVDAARAQIRDEPAQHRGTIGAMRMAVKKNLTGTQAVTIQERTGGDGSTPDAYHIVISFFTIECPRLDLLIAAVEAVKPGGIQITYNGVFGNIWNAATRQWQAEPMTWDETANTKP